MLTASMQVSKTCRLGSNPSIPAKDFLFTSNDGLHPSLREGRGPKPAMEVRILLPLPRK